MYDEDDPTTEYSIQFVRKYLIDNIAIPTNIEGTIVDANHVTINLACRAVMLGHDPTSSATLSDIYSAPPPEERRARLDDK